MLRHQLWLMRVGYRPDRRNIRQLIDSHLEALAEIDRLRAAPAHPLDYEGDDFT